MAPKRFFIDNQQLNVGAKVTFPESEADHVRNSLRLKVGDTVRIFNGREEFEVMLTKVGKDTVEGVVNEELVDDTTLDKHIRLVLGLIKPQNFELAIQKTTELGVDEIVPLITEYSQINPFVVERKLTRWQKIAVEACKQSGRVSVPTITIPYSIDELSDVLQPADLTLVLHADDELSEHLSLVADRIKDADTINFIIGPEGGFSPAELEEFEARQWPLVGLPRNILRAETAAIAALSIINYILTT